ncbi:hypothetical protein GCM10011380_33750 [Sphingomonas metalli]|uniref:Uncharacterized protein n=1 Tax=Sphingomonas metalli TaxID=1779358 RepID=A0A916TFC2_9SPHN|nr:DUF6445 family protein [Sphingomonas metalli]GGB41531.1 hypothetical protein GCM10011380_33750 [Sphingomonas metalli]
MTSPAIAARRIGTERQPIAIIDQFHPDPDALRTAACVAIFEPGRHHYPGIRAALPQDYFAAVRAPLLTTLREVFAQGTQLALLDASFAMVTQPPDSLAIAQRIPHVDAVDIDRIALVHYLGPGDGTAFYRHRSTGFETVDAARGSGYRQTLRDELAAAPPPPAYIADSTPLFERIALVEARYNRAVLYRSRLLHSGAIAPDAALSDDPAQGRLTITAFLSAR